MTTTTDVRAGEWRWIQDLSGSADQSEEGAALIIAVLEDWSMCDIEDEFGHRYRVALSKVMRHCSPDEFMPHTWAQMEQRSNELIGGGS